jgi:ketosteroid isomerase-like protein
VTKGTLRAMPRRRTVALLAAAAAASLAGGCGKSDDDKVRDTLARFEQATEKRDYKALCDDVLSEQVVQRLRAVGLPCETALQRSTVASTLQPSITVEQVKVRGDTALAQITSTAVGQRASHDTIRLVKQGDDWRVSSLSGAQPPAPPRDAAGHAEE